MFDIISIGDCTIDTLLQIHDAEINCKLHPDVVICVNFAENPVDNHRSGRQRGQQRRGFGAAGA